MVMRLLMCDTQALQEDRIFACYYREVSAYRYEHIRNALLPEERRCRLAATVLLDRCLREVGLREQRMLYSEGKDGKPFFRDHPELYFSIAHSGTKVLLSFGSESGCDIQRIIPVDLDAMKLSLTETERQYVGRNRRRFFRVWVLKESYMKFCGKGLKKDPASFAVVNEKGEIRLSGAIDPAVRFREYDLGKYVAAVCSREIFPETVESVIL